MVGIIDMDFQDALDSVPPQRLTSKPGSQGIGGQNLLGVKNGGKTRIRGKEGGGHFGGGGKPAMGPHEDRDQGWCYLISSQIIWNGGSEGSGRVFQRIQEDPHRLGEWGPCDKEHLMPMGIR